MRSRTVSSQKLDSSSTNSRQEFYFPRTPFPNQFTTVPLFVTIFLSRNSKIVLVFLPLLYSFRNMLSSLNKGCTRNFVFIFLRLNFAVLFTYYGVTILHIPLTQSLLPANKSLYKLLVSNVRNKMRTKRTESPSVQFNYRFNHLFFYCPTFAAWKK